MTLITLIQFFGSKQIQNNNEVIVNSVTPLKLNMEHRQSEADNDWLWWKLMVTLNHFVCIAALHFAFRFFFDPLSCLRLEWRAGAAEKVAWKLNDSSDP